MRDIKSNEKITDIESLRKVHSCLTACRSRRNYAKSKIVSLGESPPTVIRVSLEKKMYDGLAIVTARGIM